MKSFASASLGNKPRQAAICPDPSAYVSSARCSLTYLNAMALRGSDTVSVGWLFQGLSGCSRVLGQQRCWSTFPCAAQQDSSAPCPPSTAAPPSSCLTGPNPEQSYDSQEPAAPLLLSLPSPFPRGTAPAPGDNPARSHCCPKSGFVAPCALSQ